MEEIIENQQLDQQPTDSASPTGSNRNRRRLIYGVAALLGALLLLGVVAAYLYRREVLTILPTPSKVTEERTEVPAATTKTAEEAQKPAAVPETSEKSLDQELDELERDLGTLDQVDNELNSPEVDLDLGL